MADVGEWWRDAAGAPGGAGEAGEARAAWDRDEWDVALSDGGVYRDLSGTAPQTAWFIDAICD